jgi:Protein of unknown function (DUF559)
MDSEARRSRDREAWAIARSQHWAIALAQLCELGFSRAAIRHRVAIGRLHPVFRGVYAVGRAHLGDLGRWKAATLSCGPSAAISHLSAAALWGFATEGPRVEVSDARRAGSRPGLLVHRSPALEAAMIRRSHGIPVTCVARTMVDIAATVPRARLEAAVEEACRNELTDPESLRAQLGWLSGRRGAGRLAELLDRDTFVLTESWLERSFLPLSARAGLGQPRTQTWLNGHRVDFFWPELGLVVETDGLRFHRTVSRQARDHKRDQAHAAAGLTCLRFSHAQVRYEPERVVAVLAEVGKRLRVTSGELVRRGPRKLGAHD